MMTNPYPGLRSFEYNENHLFFGREGQAQEIATRLEQSHFVAVVGTSGSGKSSLVRAGLIPLLYGGRMFESSSHWRISLMRPGDTPIHNLAASLVHPEEFDTSLLNDAENTKLSNDETQTGIVETILRRSGVGLSDFLKTADLEDGEKLLIIIDQFEELFRFKQRMQTGDADEARAFVKLLLEATTEKQNRIYIVMTMRSDFLGNCAEFRGLPEAINKGQYLVSRMTRNQLRSSIELPAKVFDAEFSPVLVNRLLNNLEDDRDQSLESRERMLQDQLPVLQHAMMRTWEEWEKCQTPDEQINMEHYNAVGGMEKALLNHANEAYLELTDKQKIIAEKLFKCLTEKDEENRETRRPSTVGEICEVAEAESADVFAVIEVFRQKGRTFLMPPPSIPLTHDTKIDISHESLIRNWDVLRKWVKEEGKDAWYYRRLSEDSSKWLNEQGKDEGFLWRGRVVKDAIDWWTNFIPNRVWASRYQILTDHEKRQMAKLCRISPDEEPFKRQELLTERFNEAKAFLDESADFEIREHAREKQLRQAEARGRYTKWLAGAAVVLVLLLGATAYFAYSTYNARKDLEAKQKDLEANQEELETKNIEITEEQNNLILAEKDLEEIVRHFDSFAMYTNLTTEALSKTKKKLPGTMCTDSKKNEKEQWSVLECAGVYDFNLEVYTKATGDRLFQTLNVIAPSGEKYALNFQKIFSSNNFVLGDQVAQWRLKTFKEKRKPIALIVPINVMDEPEDSSKITHYLTISKITEHFACVTAVIKPIKMEPTKNEYMKARVEADTAVGKPCLLSGINKNKIRIY